MSTEQFDANEYHLQFLSVKMKVKFPCKMKLEHSNNTITDEVAFNQHHKFMFAQDVIIKEECEKQSFDVNVLLITEKGAKYVSGVIRLSHVELQKSEGDKIICPLVKCLDSDAFCQLKVNRVKSGRLPKRISVSNSVIELKRLNSNKDIQIQSPSNGEKQIYSPRVKKSQAAETRSQIGMGRQNGQIHQWQDARSKGPAQTLIYKNTFLKSPKAKNNIGTGLPKMMSEFNHEYEGVSMKEKFSEAQVYKEGYQKLKQKYRVQSQTAKIQANKRVQLEANENNYKIQIMRLKLKTQEQEKIIIQKNEKINLLQLNLSQINKQQLDMKYLNEENSNLEHKIRTLNDSINSLNNENHTLKKLSEDRIKGERQITTELREELEAVSSRLEKLTIQSQETNRKKTQQILTLESELKAKISTIDMQKNQIHKLETHMQNKLFDFERTLQDEKNSGNSAVNQLRQRIQLLEREKKTVQVDLDDYKGRVQKIKSLILKVEYDKKILIEEQQVIKKQLLQFKALKDKFTQISRQAKFLKEDKQHLNKQLQATNSSKVIDLSEISEQYESKMTYYKKQMKDLQEKVKSVSTAKIQLESQLEITQNSLQKAKRQSQTSNNEASDFKNKSKELKAYSNTLQQQNLTLQNQISLLNNKMRFGDQASRIESQKYREQISKIKLELGSQNLKNVQLNQTKNTLQIELGKKKIQLQYAEQKIEKLNSGNKQLNANLDHTIKESEQQINQLQQTITKQETEIRSLHERLHKNQMHSITQNQAIQTQKRNNKILEERTQHLQNQLKIRQQELNKSNEQAKLQEKTLSQTQTSLSALKNDYSILKNQKSKNQKILLIRQQDLEDEKQKLKALNNAKEQVEKQLLEQKSKLKEAGQTYTKLEMKQRSTEREYTRFKELMISTIKNEYSKIPTLNSETPGHSTQNLPTGNQQPTNSQIQSQLLSNITESKKTLFKLVQHNKQLKKQIQTISTDLEKDSNKYQFTQLELNRDIQQLEEEMHILYEEKEEELINSDKMVSQLNAIIHEKESLIEELNMQCQELEYALSTIKLDFQTNNDQNDKRVNTLKSNIEDLEEKIQHYRHNLSSQEDANHDLEEKLEQAKTQTEELNDKYLKQIMIIQNLEAQKSRVQLTLEQNIASRKQLLEKNNVLEICLNQERGLKTKSRQLLEMEEKRSKEQKEFTTILIKEKEELIKSYLELTDRILKLETVEIELNRDIQISSEQNQRIKSELQELKQKYKKQYSAGQSVTKSLSESESKLNKLEEKQQQLSKEINLKDEIIAKLDLKYKQLAEKNYKDTLQLHSQIDKKYSENIDLSKQTSQKITLLEAQVEELEHIKTKMHNDNILQGDELLAEKEQNELFKRQVFRLETQLESANEQLERLELRISNQEQELQQRQQNQNNFNQRVLVLEGQLEAQMKDKQLKLEELNSEWNRKYQSMLEDEEKKLQVLSNERNLISDQLEEKIAQLEVSLVQYKNSESGTSSIRKNYEEKLKKIEDARLHTIQQKNNEIKILIEEKKALSKSVKEMETVAQQSSNLLDSIRKRLSEQQKLRKEDNEKHKCSIASKEQQISSLMRKQFQYSELREKFLKIIWSNERQVKKVIQAYLKGIMDQCDSKHIDKVTNASKGMQTVVITAMMDRISSL